MTNTIDLSEISKMSAKEFAALLQKITDDDIGRAASGGYGAVRRQQFNDALRRMASLLSKPPVQVAA